jgi:hypothetical protein
MTKRTRIFLLGAGGILVAGLGTGVFASYMGGIQNVMLLSGGRPAELAYIPADAKMLAFANVREVMDSELRNKFLELHMPPGDSPSPDSADADPDTQPDTDSELQGAARGTQALYDATGVDVEKDIDHVVATLAGTDDNKHPLVIARGRFDNGRIEAAIQQKSDGNVQIEDYKGIRLVSASEKDGDSVSLAFAEPGVLVMGSNSAVKRAIDAKISGNDVRDNATLMKFVDDVDNGNAWVVSRFDAITGQTLPQEIASQLPPITWFSASGHVNGGVTAMIRAETRDDASAENLREVIRGFMALARLQTSQQPQIAELMNTLELGGEGKTVSLGFSISSEMIDAIAALRGAAKPATGAALHQTPPVLHQALRSW